MIRLFILVFSIVDLVLSTIIWAVTPSPFTLEISIVAGNSPPFAVGNGAWLLVSSEEVPVVTGLYGVKVGSPTIVQVERGFATTIPYQLTEPAAAVRVRAGDNDQIFVLQGVRVFMPILRCDKCSPSPDST